MLPHFFLLFVTTSFAALADVPRLSRGVGLVLWSFVILYLTLFAGWRAETVGADTAAYIQRIELLQLAGSIWEKSTTEPGYKAIVALGLRFGNSPHAVLLLLSFIAVLTYIVSVIKLSVQPAVSFFFFITYGYFLFHLNGARQGLAFGFYLLAIVAVLRGRLLTYVGWVLVGALFHTSALLTLPLYFVFRIGYSLFNMCIMFAVAAVFYFSADILFSIAGLVNERYVTYGDRTETGGALLALFYFVHAAFFILWRGWIQDRDLGDYDRLLMIMMFGTMIHLVVFVTNSYVEMNRLALYFTAASVFLWPMVFRSSVTATSKNIVIFAGFASGLLFFYFFLSKIGGYAPYRMYFYIFNV